MKKVTAARHAPHDLDAALYMIADVARRDNLSPTQVIDMFEDGMLVSWWRSQDALWPAIANTAQTATENVAQQGV